MHIDCPNSMHLDVYMVNLAVVYHNIELDIEMVYIIFICICQLHMLNHIIGHLL